MSTLCTLCNSYPCPGCTGAVIDENVRLRAQVASTGETLARLADEHVREMAEAERLLDECRLEWRRRGLALQDVRSFLLGRLAGTTGPLLLASVERALDSEGVHVAPTTTGKVQAVGDQMPRVRVLLQQAVARYVLRTGHPAWVLMPEHFKGGPRVSLRFIEETRPDFGEQVLVGHGADEETAARDLIAKLGYTVDSSPEKVAAVRERFGMAPEGADDCPHGAAWGKCPVSGCAHQ